MATTYRSVGSGTDFTTAANWDDIAAGCPGTATAVVAPTVFDTFNICDTHTITLGAPATADWVSVKPGGTLALGAFALTATTRLQIDDEAIPGTPPAGTVTSSSATTAHQLAFLNVGFGTPGATGPVANLGGAQISGNVQINSGTLTLGSNSSVGGNVIIDAGTFAGTLRFTDANHTINAQSAAKTIPNLDLSLMTTGRTITIVAPGQNVTFTNVAGRSLECPVGTPYNGTAITGGTICTVGAAVVTPSVSAPIFSTKEKPAVFSEEVK